MNALVPIAEVMTSLSVIGGDYKKLTLDQRKAYIDDVCQRTTMNPVTQPIIFIEFQGKIVPYVTKDGTDQLRKINGISIEIVSIETRGGVLIVRAKATDKHGRSDEDFGAVSVGELRGGPAANAVMKAATKAKRRVTLAISGLGILDESEIEDSIHVPTSSVREGKPLKAIDPSLSSDERSAEVERQAEQENEAREARVSAESQTDHLEPYKIERAGDDVEAFRRWATTLMACIRAAPDATTVNDWITANADHFSALMKLDPDKHKDLLKVINKEMATRNEEGQ